MLLRGVFWLWFWGSGVAGVELRRAVGLLGSEAGNWGSGYELSTKYILVFVKFRFDDVTWCRTLAWHQIIQLCWGIVILNSDTASRIRKFSFCKGLSPCFSISWFLWLWNMRWIRWKEDEGNIILLTNLESSGRYVWTQIVANHTLLSIKRAKMSQRNSLKPMSECQVPLNHPYWILLCAVPAGPSSHRETYNPCKIHTGAVFGLRLSSQTSGMLIAWMYPWLNLPFCTLNSNN